MLGNNDKHPSTQKRKDMRGDATKDVSRWPFSHNAKAYIYFKRANRLPCRWLRPLALGAGGVDRPLGMRASLGRPAERFRLSTSTATRENQGFCREIVLSSRL